MTSFFLPVLYSNKNKCIWFFQISTFKQFLYFLYLFSRWHEVRWWSVGMASQESFPPARAKHLYVCCDCPCDHFCHVHSMASFLFSASHQASVSLCCVLWCGRYTQIRLSEVKIDFQLRGAQCEACLACFKLQLHETE